jgi:hypothetical protein
MSRKELATFAAEVDWCAVCWSRHSLHIHHMVQGTGRQNHRFMLVRLCDRCHRALHDGGSFAVTKGMVLTAKREQDPEHYDPTAMAGLKHRQALPYGLEPYGAQALRERRTPPEDYMVRSRDKGCRGEREAAAAINAVAPRAMAYRAQQHSGTESSSDVVCPGMPDLWVEVKRVEKLNLLAAFAKAAEQCGKLTPIVVHRKNGGEWMVTCRLEEMPVVARNFTHASIRAH